MKENQLVDFLDTVVSTYMPQFEYRENQKELILQVLWEFLFNNKKYVILQSDTGCFTGDTTVRLAENISVTMKELSTNPKYKNGFYLFSSTNEGEIKVCWATSCWKTKTTSDLVKITLDDGTSYKCTPDHRWLKRNGEYCRADQLKINDSLMPLYTSMNNNPHKFHKDIPTSVCDRFCIYQPVNNDINYVYQLSARHVGGLEMGYNIHHIDFGKMNDDPSNLIKLTRNEHIAIHAKELSKNSEVQRIKSLKGWYDKDGNKNRDAVNRTVKMLLERNSTEFMKKSSQIKSAYMRYKSNFYSANIPNYDKCIRMKRGKGGIKVGLNNKLKTFGENSNEYLEQLEIYNNHINTINELEKTIIVLSDEENYREGMQTLEEFTKEYLIDNNTETYDDLVLVNHSVSNIEFINEEQDVYDIEVPELNNFAIDNGNGSGVFVHNSGKSYMAYIIGRTLNEYYRMINTHLEEDGTEYVPNYSTMFLTKTIALQHQYNNDFKDMKLLKSASNYECHTEHTLPIPVTKKFHKTCKYTKTSGMCLYERARVNFYSSELQLLNYAYYFHSGGLDNVQYRNNHSLIVVDEAHLLPNYLIDYSQSVINFTTLYRMSECTISTEDYFNITDLENKDLLNLTDIRLIMEYCFDALQYLESQRNLIIKNMENLEMTSNNHKIISLIEQDLDPIETSINYFTKLGENLYYVTEETWDRWVQDKEKVHNDNRDEPDQYQFVLKSLDVLPTYLSHIQSSMHTLFMSGTCGTLADSLNLPKDEVSVVTGEYIFPLENRPFIKIDGLPEFNYTSRDNVLPVYLDTIDRLLDNMPESGIIHSVSYANAKYIKQNSRHKNRIYIPSSEEVRNIKKIVKPGMVLTSPAILEGIDLTGDLSSFQIFIKVPYPNLSSEWMKRKLKENSTWYQYEALSAVLQGSGRSVRTPTDKAVTIMLDPSFNRLLRSVNNLVPDWFTKTLR
jgi:Rad3-related DNA helicase/intein/homing endonuclease